MYSPEQMAELIAKLRNRVRNLEERFATAQADIRTNSFEIMELKDKVERIH